MTRTPITQEAITIWTKAPGLTTWTESFRLRWENSSTDSYSLGGATFSVMHETLLKPNGETVVEALPVSGHRVIVMLGSDAPGVGNDTIKNQLFVGTFSSVVTDGFTGTGTANAVGIFDSIRKLPLVFFYQENGEDAATFIITDLPANLKVGDSIVGNKKLLSPNNNPVFSVDQRGAALWTRGELASHACAYSIVDYGEKFAFDLTAASEPDLDRSLDLTRLSLGDLIQVLYPPTEGWTVRVTWSTDPGSDVSNINLNWQDEETSGAGWYIHAVASNEGNTITSFNASGRVQNYIKEDIEPYTSVRIEGGPIYMTCTHSVESGSLQKGWTDAQQTSWYGEAYDDGDTFKPEWAGVYSRFDLKSDGTTYKAICDDGADPAMPQDMIPIDIEPDGACHVPLMRAQRSLLVDYSDSEEAALEPTPIRVFRYDGSTWYDLIDTEAGWEIPRVAPLQDGPGISIQYRYPETLAGDDWEAQSATDRYGSARNPPGVSIEGGAWQDLYVTATWDTSLRVVAINNNPNATADSNPLLVYRPDFQQWTIRDGTRLATNLTQILDTNVRDDTTKASNLATEIGKWAFRNSARIRVTLFGALTNDLQVGDYVETLVVDTDDNGSATEEELNTIVTEIAYNVDQQGNITQNISTSVGMTGGGFGNGLQTVSASTGNSFAGNVDMLKERMKRLEDAMASVPAIEPRTLGPVPLPIILIDGGNYVDQNSTIPGVKPVNSLITEVPSAYDPSTQPSTIDGIGYGRIISDGSLTYVLLCNDNKYGLPLPLVEDRASMAIEKTQLLVTGSNPAVYVTAYRVIMI